MVARESLYQVVCYRSLRNEYNYTKSCFLPSKDVLNKQYFNYTYIIKIRLPIL